MAKNLFAPSSEIRFERDPRFHYLRECIGDQESVLPVLHYVHMKTLCLEGYTLSIGHAKALAKACEQFSDSGINRIILDNCGVDDEEFSEILKGLQKLKDFKKIIYRYNVMKDESIEAIQPILHAKIPNHLEELRIENCKLTGIDTQKILEILLEQSFLKKLAFVDAGFTSEGFNMLIEFATKNIHM